MSLRFTVVEGGTPPREQLAAIELGLAMVAVRDEVSAKTSSATAWEHTARREAVGLAGQAAGSNSSSPSSAAWAASSGVA